MYKCACVCMCSIFRWKRDLACIGAWLGSLSAACFIRVVRYNNIIIGRRRIILYNNNIIDPRSRIDLKTSRALLSLWSSVVHTAEDIFSRYVILFNTIFIYFFAEVTYRVRRPAIIRDAPVCLVFPDSHQSV